MQNTRGQVAARLRGAGLTCNVLNEDDFRASMFEKHMWICAFMLLGVHHGGTVGDVAAQHRSAPCSPASPLPCVCVCVCACVGACARARERALLVSQSASQPAHTLSLSFSLSLSPSLSLIPL